MEFVGGLLTGFGITIVVVGSFAQHDLNDCAKKYDVYECELVAVPKGGDDGMATD